MTRSLRLLPVLFVTASLLAGCESPEEKAEGFYQSALSYLEDSDTDRAMIELRNVFSHDGFHKEARALYAGLQYGRGNLTEAYGQYLRLVEQYPDTVEAREALALMALERRSWDEAIRHGEQAMALGPDRIGTRAIAAALDYRTAILARNPQGEAAAVVQARAVLADDPSAQAARRVVIDALLRADDPQTALIEIGVALDYAPESQELNTIKAQLLGSLDDQPGLGTHLRRMYEVFPGNEEVRIALIRWYITQEDFDAAEAFLRAEAGPAGTDSDGNITVVELLRRTQGTDAATAELDRLITDAGETAAGDLYRGLRALADFEAGRRDAAIAALQSVLETADPSDQTRGLRIMLARMLNTTGNVVGAREQVERVLAEDGTDVEALKMRATWAIRDDRLGEAIIGLRAALDQSPRDTAILALMAEAFLRDGNPELAQERLAMAVQVSDGGAQESVSYARFLTSRNRPQQAETVLSNARTTAPGNVEILGLLGEIHLRAQQWPQAQNVIETLRQIDTPQARQLAQVYQSSILLGQNRIDEGLDYLRAQIAADGGGGGDLSAMVQLVRTLIVTGRLEEARSYIDEQFAARPDSIPLELLSANIRALQGQLQEAETIYRDLLSRQPDIEPAILQLQALLRATDRPDEAEEVVQAGLDALPQSRRLRLLEAYRLEQRGNYDMAIAIYELLYEQDSSDVVVANNLASMLSNYRDGEEVLDRAHTIARRLTGTDVPAFQDTLGRILYLRGDIDGAIALLEPAAEALPEEASVVIHLGLAYVKAGRTEDAKATLQRGLDLAGDAELPSRQLAQEALDAL